MPPINGIIAEYNPLHKGHAYQLSECKKKTSAAYTVIVMSGNYVQRGEPAIIDKQIRTELALRSGADLVLELPVFYSCSSSRYFAEGAVDLMNKSGIITHLCFGSESGNLDELCSFASLLNHETEYFKTALNKHLSNGHSYPAARALAWGDISQGKSTLNPALPNNILAVEYIAALSRTKSRITPVTITRSGSGYHTPTSTPGEFSSATALRHLLLNRNFSKAASHVPKEASESFLTYLEHAPLITIDDYSAILSYLLSFVPDGIHDFPAYLWQRIKKRRNEFTTISSFISDIKSRNITYTSISRSLLHWMLGLTSDMFQTFYKGQINPYIRILGFRKDSQPLLRMLKEHAKVPIITKAADYQKVLSSSPEAVTFFEKSRNCDDLYYRMQSIKKGEPAKCELTRKLIIL